MKVTVVHRDRFYIPEHAVNVNALRRLAEVEYQTKAHCSPTCPFARKQGRFCSTCPGREARIRMWTKVTTPNGLRLIAVAAGNRDKLDEIVRGGYRIVDRRANPEYRHDIRWTGRLRRGETVKGKVVADQHGMLARWRARIRSGETGGIVISPPRSGKCVYPDTMIRTENGYHHISRLLSAYPYNMDVEKIGRYGKILGPLGTREVRGLYSRMVSEHVKITLSNGAELGGSTVHPIETEGDGWVTLGNLRHDHRILSHQDTADPVPSGNGLSVEQATLAGLLVFYSDPAKFATGVVDINRASMEQDPRLARLLHTICRLEPSETLMCDLDKLPVMREWSPPSHGQPTAFVASIRHGGHEGIGRRRQHIRYHPKPRRDPCHAHVPVRRGPHVRAAPREIL